jgi:hypothetical protein
VLERAAPAVPVRAAPAVPASAAPAVQRRPAHLRGLDSQKS